MHDSPHASSQFTLKHGEIITDCSPLWTSGSDRILEEIASCNHCLRSTYRVIVVTSAAGLNGEPHYASSTSFMLPGRFWNCGPIQFPLAVVRTGDVRCRKAVGLSDSIKITPPQKQNPALSAPGLS